MAANRTRWVTIDTSALFAIDYLGLFTQLTYLFDRIHIPRCVRTEFSKKPGSRGTLSRICRDLHPYRFCYDADPLSLQLLLHEYTDPDPQKPRKHEGEIEAIVQAATIGAPIVIADDQQATEWAKGMNLECHATLWILDYLREQELIGSLVPMFARLRREDRWLPEAEIKRMLEKFNEEYPATTP